MLGIISYYKLPFKYTGNGTYYIENKNPDFVSLETGKIIELFGKYWHKDINEPSERTTLFKSFGFDTLIIYDTELTAKNLGRVINKMIQFSRR